MKRSIVFSAWILALAGSSAWARDPRWPGSPDRPVYSAPEPAAVAEIALVGAGLGIWAWRRRKAR